MIGEVLAAARKRIARSKKLNENDTKATLIEPVLAALGWDVLDPEEVAREHKAPRGKPVDYALLVMREPKLYVEAKALGENLQDSRVAHQIMGYASVAGVEWVVLTNGDEWRIYNSHATVPVDQKLLRAVRLSDPQGTAEEILRLLSKDQLKERLIDHLWRAQFVDRQVQAAIEGFFSPDKDMALVNHVRAVAKDLSPEDIRSSMRRCNLALDFPLSPGDVAKVNPGPRPPPKVIGVTLPELIRARMIKPSQKLVGRYKGKVATATVQKDGNVEFAGKSYASLSTAGSAALATLGGTQRSGEPRAVNGWDFWHVEEADGHKIPIARFRDRMNGASDASVTAG